MTENFAKVEDVVIGCEMAVTSWGMVNVVVFVDTRLITNNAWVVDKKSKT